MGSPFCHPWNTGTHTISFLFPCTRMFQVLVITGLQDVICMEMYIGILLGFFSASINGTGSNNSTDVLGAENHFGNGHFLGKC